MFKMPSPHMRASTKQNFMKVVVVGNEGNEKRITKKTTATTKTLARAARILMC